MTISNTINHAASTLEQVCPEIYKGIHDNGRHYFAWEHLCAQMDVNNQQEVSDLLCDPKPDTLAKLRAAEGSWIEKIRAGAGKADKADKAQPTCWIEQVRLLLKFLSPVAVICLVILFGMRALDIVSPSTAETLITLICGGLLIEVSRMLGSLYENGNGGAK